LYVPLEPANVPYQNLGAMHVGLQPNAKIAACCV
jgi:hypothetical protein